MVRHQLLGFGHAVLDVTETIGDMIWKREPVISAALNGEAMMPDPPPVPPEPPAAPPRFEQFGLKLPNGNIAWTTYAGHPLSTSQERGQLVEVLRRTAVDLCFDADDFLSHYGWARRLGVPAVQWGDIELYPLVVEDESKDVVLPALSDIPGQPNTNGSSPG